MVIANFINLLVLTAVVWWIILTCVLISEYAKYRWELYVSNLMPLPEEVYMYHINHITNERF